MVQSRCFLSNVRRWPYTEPLRTNEICCDASTSLGCQVTKKKAGFYQLSNCHMIKVGWFPPIVELQCEQDGLKSTLDSWSAVTCLICWLRVERSDVDTEVVLFWIFVFWSPYGKVSHSFLCTPELRSCVAAYVRYSLFHDLWRCFCFAVCQIILMYSKVQDRDLKKITQKN